MKYDLISPCGNCPFRCDVPGFLSEERAQEIAESITRRQQTFSCHKMNEFDDEGEPIESENSQHCAGALIMLEKMEQPNQMMRVCERLGMYDRRKLRMDAPVFDDAEEFVEHHAEATCN